MLRRVGLGAVVVASLAVNCGGESERVLNGGSAGHRATTGGAGKSFGAAGCLPCATGGTGGIGATGGVGGGVTGGSAGHAGDKPGSAQGGKSAAAGDGGAGKGGSSSVGGTSATGGRAGTSASGGRGGSSGVGASVSDGGAAGEPNPLAGKLALAKLAVYQAVEVTLMKDGVDTTPNAPVIIDRAALVRVWVAPDSQWVPRNVHAELKVAHGGTTRTAKATDIAVAGASKDLDLATTFEFSLRDTEVQDDTTLELSVSETTTAPTELGHWPASGQHALGAQSSHGAFLVTLVPLVVNGFTPDASQATANRYRRYLSHLYPASNTDISVRDPVSLSFDVTSDGGGWDAALDELYAVRDRDDPPANVYYYGLLTPGATYADYCPVDCVVGLSSVAARSEEQYRGAIGTDYFASNTDTFSQETLAHEMGHALGRDHSPCGGPDGVDRGFPYSYGQIGVTGYDGQNLLDRDDYKDVMSYCVPVWISDYVYQGIFTRISYVNGLAAKRASAGAPPRSARARFQTLALRADGSLHWGREKAPAAPPAGDPLDVELLDASGALLDIVRAPFARFDHLGGGFLSVPSSLLARADVASVRVDGHVLAVSLRP